MDLFISLPALPEIKDLSPFGTRDEPTLVQKKRNDDKLPLSSKTRRSTAQKITVGCQQLR